MILYGPLGITIFLAAYVLCSENEIYCSPYHYHEQTLAKIVRLEFQMEQLEKRVSYTETDCANKVCSQCKQCPDMWIPFQGSCYSFVHEARTYFGAKAHCNLFGAHLVYIENSAENDFLRTQLASLKDAIYWIGLTDLDEEGLFRWDNGSVLGSFSDWTPAQPNNYDGKQDCVLLHHNIQYQWNDWDCTVLHKSVCEK